jgi:hypothetical protein
MKIRKRNVETEPKQYGTAFAVFAGFKEITFKILMKKYRSKKPRKILKHLKVLMKEKSNDLGKIIGP